MAYNRNYVNDKTIEVDLGEFHQFTNIPLASKKHLDVDTYPVGAFNGLIVNGVHHSGAVGTISVDANGKKYIERDFTAVGTTIPFTTGVDNTVPWTIALIIKIYADTNRLTFGQPDENGAVLGALNIDIGTNGTMYGVYTYPLSFVLNGTYQGAIIGNNVDFGKYVDADYVLVVSSYDGSVTGKNSMYIKTLGVTPAEYESTGAAIAQQITTEFAVGFTENSADNNYRLHEMMLFNEYVSPSNSTLLEKINLYFVNKYTTPLIHLDINTYPTGAFNTLNVNGTVHDGAGTIVEDANGKKYVQQNFAGIGRSTPFSVGDGAPPPHTTVIIYKHVSTCRLTNGVGIGNGGVTDRYNMDVVTGKNIFYPMSAGGVAPGLEHGINETLIHDSPYLCYLMTTDGTTEHSLYLAGYGFNPMSVKYTTSFQSPSNVSSKFSIGGKVIVYNEFKFYEMMVLNGFVDVDNVNDDTMKYVNNYFKTKYTH